MWKWLARLLGIRAKEPQAQGIVGLSEQAPGDYYLIGPTADLMKQQHLIAPDDPRRTLFDYHMRREEEQQSWGAQDPRQILASENSAAPARLTKLLEQARQAYATPELHDLVEFRPCPEDAALADLCHAYRDGSPAARSFLRAQVKNELAWSLLTFSKRVAVQAVRQGKANLLRDSLLAQALENLAAGDVRDNMVALGLIYHCMRTLQADPVALFEAVADLAGPAISQLLRDFVRRPDLDDILPLMGWYEVQTPQGIGYHWGDDPNEEEDPEI